MKATRLVIHMVLILTAGAGAQESADPAGLIALRQRYQALLLEVEAPARTRWLASLEALERQKVAEGDFVAAAALRERRLALLGTSGAAGQTRNAILLPAASARTGTGIDFPDAKKEVGRFRRTGALMEWELPGQTPGLYQVNLVCGVMGETDENNRPDPLTDPKAPLPVRATESIPATAAGGVVEFRKLTNLKEGGALLRRTVRSTGGWAMTRVLTLGTVELDSKIVKFSLRAAEALPAGLMDFHRLELVPAVPVAPPGGASEAGGIKDLAKLRELYQTQFAGLTKGVSARYLKSLGELEANAARTRDNDTLAMVRQEKKRIERGSLENGPVAETSHLLPVTEKLYMLLSGEARLTSQGDYLTRLRPAKTCEVTWKLAGLGVTSGTYTVELDCRLTPEHGGTATLAAATPGGTPGPPLTISIEAPDFGRAAVATKRKPDGTPGTSMTRSFKAGKVIIPKGSEYLTLRVDSLKVPDGGLFDLKSLRLTPVAPPAP